MESSKGLLREVVNQLLTDDQLTGEAVPEEVTLKWEPQEESELSWRTGGGKECFKQNREYVKWT